MNRRLSRRNRRQRSRGHCPAHGQIVRALRIEALEQRLVLYNVCSDDFTPCTHEAMTAEGLALFYHPQTESPTLLAQEIRNYAASIFVGVANPDQSEPFPLDPIYGNGGIGGGLITINHFWNPDADIDAPMEFNSPLGADDYPNAFGSAQAVWSRALGEYAAGNKTEAYRYLGMVAHFLGDQSIPTHVHGDTHGPDIIDYDSFEEWMSEPEPSDGNLPTASVAAIPGVSSLGVTRSRAFLTQNESDQLRTQGILDPSSDATEINDQLLWIFLNTNQVADFFASDGEGFGMTGLAVNGDANHPSDPDFPFINGWAQDAINEVASDCGLVPQGCPTVSGRLIDNHGSNVNQVNDNDGDLSLIRKHSFLHGVQAMGALFELWVQAISTPIVGVTIQNIVELGSMDFEGDPDFYVGIVMGYNQHLRSTTPAGAYLHERNNNIPRYVNGEFMAANLTRRDAFLDENQGGTEDQSSISPNYRFGQSNRYFTSNGYVPGVDLVDISLVVWENDETIDPTNDPYDSDDPTEINGDATRLDITVDLAKCVSGTAGAVAIDTTHACSTTIRKEGTGDDSEDVQVDFSITMFMPPTVAGDPANGQGIVAPDGTLTLFMGPHSAHRFRTSSVTDDAEEFAVEHISGSPNEPLGETVKVRAFGYEQRVSGVRRIVAYGGEQNDVILIGDTVSSPAELHGGTGNDRLTYAGTGIAAIFGDQGDDQITGGSQNDILGGGLGNDFLVGNGGDDTIYGHEGNDQIVGNGGGDNLFGHDGDDEIDGGEGDDTLTGGAGNDRLYAQEGTNQYLYGNEGRDILVALGGRDFLFGGPENDVLSSGAGNDDAFGDDGDDVIYGEAGDDRLEGGAGNDRIEGATGIDIIRGGAADDLIYGNEDRDVIYGDDGNDVIHAGEGNNDVYGGLGDDTITAGIGDDFVDAGDGSDTITASRGNNTIHAGAGNDIVTAGTGNDIVDAGSGNDNIQTSSGIDNIYGQAGIDSITTTGGGDDLIEGGPDADTITTADGNDTIRGNDGGDIIVAGDGNNIVDGGTGNDRITTGVGNDAVHGGDGDDIIVTASGIDNVYGQAGLDSITTTGDGDDYVEGGLDADTITTADGSDTIFGNDGNDIIVAGDGNNIVDGGTGNDRITTGVGNDTVYGGDGDDTIVTSSGIDFIYGQAGNDSITTTGSGDDRVEGGLDADTITTADGNDTIFGHEGNDTITSGSGIDRIWGDADDDYIDAGSGDDEVRGNLGNDTIYGREDDDYVEGNEGNDFIYTAAGTDIIWAGDGADYVDSGDDNDEVHGGIGNDNIFAGSGIDLVWGDVDDDQIDAGSGDDDVQGNSGHDTIYGRDGRDRILGDSGNDTIYGGNDDDVIDAGDGNDFVYAEAGNDIAVGGDGDDLIEGGTGVDKLLGDMGTVGATVILLGGIGRDLIRGQDGDDWIYGQASDDALEGNAGQDTIFGHDGNDIVSGGTDRDYIVAGAGNDTVQGNEADDLIEAGSGDDQVEGNLGFDRIYGGDGNDTIYGFAATGTSDNAPENIYGEAGNDTLYGSGGNDQLHGGLGIDVLHGLAGNDTLLAGGGIGDQLNGGDGGDWIQGSDDGSDVDPNFGDTIYFGDVIDAGSGNDTVLGLGGADSIRAGDGDDWVDSGRGGDRIWGGLGNDYLYAGRGIGEQIDAEQGDDVVYGAHEGDDVITGGLGRDRLFGQAGNDFISGNEDDDQIDGGPGTDQLFGNDGNDTILAGTGTGDALDGGSGSDVLRGSDDGADSLTGGDGRDQLFGFGGNDTLSGGLGDDQLDGGAGDDTLSGDAGADLLIGGSQHDTLYGHSVSGSGDDNAVDFLYGDFGTNRDEAGSGRDRLYGQGGNDRIWGEGDDDFIDVGAGTSDYFDYGSGEGATPSNFVPPTPTGNPPLLPIGTGISQAAATLAELSSPRGLWSELGGDDAGATRSLAGAIEPSTAIDASGSRYLAWVDARRGNHEIYVARYVSGSGWQELPTLTGGSASELGISGTLDSSRRPSIAINAAGQPIVAWTEFNGTATDIRVAQFDPAANGSLGAWVALANSLEAGGVSGTGTADSPILVMTNSGPSVAWLNNTAGNSEIRVQRFNGTSWVSVGTPVVASVPNTSYRTHMSYTTDGTKLAVAWAQPVATGTQIYVKEFDGTAWQELAGSASGAGVSNLSWDNLTPSVMYHGGQPFVAWQSSTQQRPEVHVKRFDGAQWQLAGVSADFGVSATMGSASQPRLVSRGGQLHLVWADDARARFGTNIFSIFATRWNGSQFNKDFTRDLIDAGIGNTRIVDSLVVTADAGGKPVVAWSEVGTRGPQVFVRDNALSPTGTRYTANATLSVQAILDANDLNPGDVIEVTSNSPGFTLAAADSGVTIVGMPGVAITGPITLNSATDVTLQALDIQGLVTISGGQRISVRESHVAGISATNVSDLEVIRNSIDCDGIVLNGAVRPIVERNAITVSPQGITLSGAGSSQISIRRNTVSASTSGILLSVASSGLIANNDVTATGIALDIQGAFSGPIRENEFRNAATGVRYVAAAALDANRIHHNTTGVLSAIADSATAFGFVGTTRPNEIHDNTTGVQLTGIMQGQFVHHNTTGITGSGSLAQSDFDHANVIESNGVGIDFNGPVQFNRIGLNGIGVKAVTRQLIAHNEFYRNTQRAVQVSGKTNVQIISNTMFGNSGDLLRVDGGSSEVEVTGNVFWAEAGYAINVANDSHAGFWSDYNLMHASETGNLVLWSNQSFADVLDWQADVASFDLHSRGTTVVNPTWSEPLLANRAADDYGLAGLLGSQRFSSVTADASNPLADLALASNVATNLLANPGFENGTAGWNVNVTGTSTAGNAFEGSRYFAANATNAGFAEQTIGLVAQGFTTTDLDGEDLVVRFGGRVRTAVEALRDSGTITLRFLNAADQVIGQTSAESLRAVDRWEQVGGRAQVPSGTRKITFRFDSARLTGSTADAILDHAFLRVHPDTIASDLGALGDTVFDTTFSAVPHLRLSYPDLYSDLERDKQHTIRWDTLGNSAERPVRIDLYQDGPHGPAFLTSIATSTTDDGEYAWTPANSSIAYGTHGLRIQVQLVGDELVLDRSTEPFSVPENTTTFFVNDRVSTNDEYTTAVGSNRNTGKLASSPKPFPNNVVRIYTLAPANTLHIDTGDYAMQSPLLISNTLGLGDDEGFTITGPTDLSRSSVLRHANPSFTSAAVLELSDADFMLLSHLATDGGTYGFWIHNGSDNFVGSHLTASHATFDGVTFESPLAGSRLEFITASANNRHGIYVTGPIDSVTDSDVGFNLGSGLYLVNQSTLQVLGNNVHDNRGTGIFARGGPITIGSSNLAAGRGNIVRGNSAYGIDTDGGSTIVGNTVSGHVTYGYAGIYTSGPVQNNLVFDNYNGITGQAPTTGNHVYDNVNIGINGSFQLIQDNVVHDNAIGIDGPYNARNNLIYNHSQRGVRIWNSSSQFINNTVQEPNATAVELYPNVTGVQLRNNILTSGNGHVIYVPTTSQPGFQSDHNVLYTLGSGKVGYWQGADRATLSAWQSATLQDANSLSQDPLFVSPATGDFHEQSLHGSYHGGSLAPVLNAGTGLPIFPTATLTVDAAQSPAIDRGLASDSFANEPTPSGGFINMGVYGNTAQASKSPAEYVLVTRPDGGEVWPVGQSFPIRWRSHDVVGDVKIELLDSGGSVVTTIVDPTPNDGEYVWSVAAGQTPGNYRVRVTRLDTGMALDTGNALFNIPEPTTVYYVNDGVVEAGDWTTVIGSDTNAGLTADAPKASIQAVLDAYDLGPGDTIRVDSGTYNTTTNILISPDDSGVTIEGYHDAAFPTRQALINRGSTASGSWTVQLIGADNVTLDHLTLTGARWGVVSLDNADSDGIAVTNSLIYGHFEGGIYAGTTNDAQRVTDNVIYGQSNVAGTGVLLGSTSGALVNRNTIHDFDSGMYVSAAFNTSAPILIEDNVTYATTYGIRGNSNANYAPITIRGNNASNSRFVGITNGNHNVLITENIVHDNPATGIEGNNIVANETFNNAVGIWVVSGGFASGNRVHHNTKGINAVSGTTIQSNTVYSNQVGVEASYGSQVRNNLVYLNSTVGVQISLSTGAVIENNTIYQPTTGNGVRAFNGASSFQIKNNIISVASGYAIDVAANSQIGVVSDYNTLHTTGTGKLALWGTREFTDRADWYYELGLDQHSQTNDPLFVNPAGLDTTLGTLDDDFSVSTSSSTIDAGHPQSQFSSEPAPRGDRINTGHTGNTSVATTSPAQFTQVLAPNGLERLEWNQQLAIDWRTYGIIEPGGNYTDAILNDAPTAFYRFGEKLGTTVVDSSGNGRTGTYVNAVTLGVTGAITAENDTAAQFSGGGYVSIPDHVSQRSAQLTVEAWVNPDSATTGFSGVLMKTTTGSWTDGYGLTRTGTGDQMRFWVNNWNGAGKVEAVVPKNQWSHVVGTYNGAELRIYVNGALATTTAYATAIAHSVQPLYLATGVGSAAWRGKLDEVAVYSSALSGPEIAQHYARGTRPVYGSVNIDLMTPGNPTPVHSIAQSTPNDGQFTWMVPTSVPEGNYVVRITANEGIQAADVSDSPLLIANSGNQYYVNDSATANDVFTTAIGSNANSGKSPSQPMASVSALVAAYDLDAGDVIHVDAGTYQLLSNIKLNASDSGVRIEGPNTAGGSPTAVLNRGNTAGGSYVFQISGADDVTLDYLAVTGGEYGIVADDNSDADRLLITNSHVYSNTQYGIYIGTTDDFAIIQNNLLRNNNAGGLFGNSVTEIAVRDNQVQNTVAPGNGTGIYVRTASATTANGGVISGNEVSGLFTGIEGQANRHIDIFNNVVHNNVSGIGFAYDVRIHDNEVYSNDGWHGGIGYGISVNGGVAENNLVYDNDRGIAASSAQIRNNRVFNNRDAGIVASFVNTIESNTIYDNEVGIHVGTNNNAIIRNNLIYANDGGGIYVGSGDGTQIENNTIYQPTGGNAVEVGGTNPVSPGTYVVSNTALRNNILQVAQGYGIRVAADSEIGTSSDYNDLYVTGTGKIGRWEDRDFTSLSDWYFETGLDRRSILANPQYVDIDGPDNVLGYDSATSTDRGLDDNFQVLVGSPTVDAGDRYSPFAVEPTPNGGRVNLGHTGNSAAAAPSSTQVVRVLSPNGLEKLETGQPISIQWQSDGLTTNRPIALIDAGGLGAGTWSADAYRTAGLNYSFTSPVDLSGVVNPAPATTYQNGSYAPTGAGNRLAYKLPVEDGTYSIRLHFAEPDLGPGQRRFDIRLQGATVQSNYDVFAAAGGVRRGTTLTFATSAIGGEGILLEMLNSINVAIVAGIELTATNPGGTANPTVNLEYSLDNGSQWLPIANNVTMDLYGSGIYFWTPDAESNGNAALIRISANQGSQPQDVSDTPFLVTNAGNEFYVNDTSVVGDALTTAIGDNLASGKTPGQPMQSLRALLDAYDLNVGDVIHVDTGTHRLYRNIRISAEDSGVRIEGHNGGGIVPVSVLHRGNTASGQYAIELYGADDVTLDHLGLTGGVYGLGALAAADSDRVTVSNGEIYGNAVHGIYVEGGNENFRIETSRVRNQNAVNTAGIVVYAAGARIENNEVFGNRAGIYVDYGSGGANPPLSNRPIVAGNSVHDNTDYGIYGRQYVLIDGNTVYGHTGVNIAGIYLQSTSHETEAVNNVTYGNYIGIQTQTANGVAAIVSHNRAYGNTEGIRANTLARIQGNQVYSNAFGIANDNNFGFQGLILNNVVYANTNHGIFIRRSSAGGQILNNTVYQSVGDAIRLENVSQGMTIRNNVLWTDSGHDIYVAANSNPANIVSQYNLLQTGGGASAHVGYWGSVARHTLADWQTASGQDTLSVAGDPQFIDRDGSDNVLGYRSVDSYDGGLDDNFRIRGGSPAIDRGDGVRTIDHDGNARADDPGTANVGAPDYLVSNDPTAFQLTGTPRNFHWDDSYTTLTLPFAFPFYGTNHTSMHVSTNGFLQFGGTFAVFDATNTFEELLQVPRIAGLWDDLTTAPASNDIFYNTSVAGQATVRWNATNKADNSDVNFAITLFNDGRVLLSYGAGNTNLTPTVGVSKGDNLHHTVPSFNDQSTLTNAASRMFTVGPGIVDLGAYEFQGSTLDTTPPTVLSSIVETVPGNANASRIRVDFSEPIDPFDALNASNYELRSAGLNGSFGDGDDIVYALMPNYVPGSTEVSLAVVGAGGSLPDGSYRFRVSGDNSIHDLSGNKLDGDNNGSAGGDFVGINNPPQFPSVQNQTTSEGVELTVNAAAADPNPGAGLTYSLANGAPAGATVHPTSGLFNWTPSESQGPGTYDVTILVTDQAAPAMSDSVAFSITVQEANSAPIVNAITDRTVDEGTLLSLPVSATDTDLPANAITYSLQAGSPAGAAIDPLTGHFTWTPDESQGPGVYDIMVLATDDGSPNLFGTQTFRVTVGEVNSAPVLAPIADYHVGEGGFVVFVASVSDADHPTNAITYSLQSGSPAGATIDPVTGLFTWSPNESQGPGIFDITVVATDDGSPNLSDTQTFRVTVAEVNSAPVLVPIAHTQVFQNQQLMLTAMATDADLPVNSLTYSLEPGAPAGAQIDGATGAFLWTPTTSVVPGNYTITVRVTDDGLPALSHTRSFTVTVLPDPTVDGDFNNDGNYDGLDINALVAQVAGGTHPVAYDLTQDGLVNLADRDAWLAEAGGVNLGPGRAYRLGDANLDGVVDGSDFGLWNANKFTAHTEWTRGNFNADGFVDGSDFGLWNANKFTSADNGQSGSGIVGSESTRKSRERTRREDDDEWRGLIDDIMAQWSS